MKTSTRVATLIATITVTATMAVPAVMAAGPGQTVQVKSEISLGAAGYQGKVKAANPNCVGERTVVLKQVGSGVLSRVKTNSSGGWKAELEELNRNIKIPAKVFAEVKSQTQATAGPIYKCLGAKSRTVTISGG